MKSEWRGEIISPFSLTKFFPAVLLDSVTLNDWNKSAEVKSYEQMTWTSLSQLCGIQLPLLTENDLWQIMVILSNETRESWL